MSLAIDTDEEILSGEAVAIDAQPLGFILRAAGAIIDMLVSFVAYIGLLFLTMWLMSNGIMGDAGFRIFMVILPVLCFLVLPLTVEVASRGRSLGKLAVGGRVVRADGGAIGFRHSFIRALLGVLEIYMTVGGTAAIAGALSARTQRLGDMAAGTYAQRVRVQPLPHSFVTLPPGMEGWARVADVARLPDRLARRISLFLHSSAQLSPGSRAHFAAELRNEVSAFVSPIPQVPDEALLVAVTVLRRERESRALRIADERTEKLSGRHVGV